MSKRNLKFRRPRGIILINGLGTVAFSASADNRALRLPAIADNRALRLPAIADNRALRFPAIADN